MFPGGQKRERESEKDCLRREIKEELPKLKLGRVRLWKEVNGTNRHSSRKMSDAIFIVNKVSGDLTIGDKHEIDKATWRKPRGTRLTPTSRYIRDMLVQPVIVGNGKLFFRDGARTELRLIATKTIDPGSVVLTYEPTR
jgi:ADP-ribose pyrophosphatase YjhB (NUDIX family)